jgi:hypothetical protein
VVADLLGGAAERRERRDERAHAAAAHPVDLEAGLDECAEDAHVGEATGAAAREDEPERPRRQPPCDPRRVGGRAVGDDVVRARPDGVEPGRDPRRRDADEHELGRVGRLEPLRRLARGDEHEPVRLPLHEVPPGPRPVEEQDVGVPRLGGVEQLRVAVRLGLAAVEQLDAPPPPQRRLELRGERGAVTRAGGEDAEHPRACLRQREPAARLQLSGELARHAQGERAVRLHESREALRVELEQPAVAHGARRGGARCAGEHAELAEDGAGADLAEQPAVGREDVQAPRQHDEEPVAGVPVVEEPLAGGDVHLARRLQELRQGLRGRTAQERRLGEPVAPTHGHVAPCGHASTFDVQAPPVKAPDRPHHRSYNAPSGTTPRPTLATCAGVNGGRASDSLRWKAQKRCTM